jgi:hypothetical protein
LEKHWFGGIVLVTERRAPVKIDRSRNLSVSPV